jgi:hypothetical protein
MALLSPIALSIKEIGQMTSTTTKEELRRRGRERHVWQERIAAAGGLSAGLRLLAIRLSMHKNLGTGRCFAGYEKLAAETLTTMRSAMRQIATLERLGWIAVTRGGGSGKANEYRFLIPETTETMTGVSQFECDQKTMTQESPQYGRGSYRASERESAHAREDRSGARASDGPSPGGRTNPAAAAKNERERGRAGASRTVGGKSRPDSGYLELQQVWAVRGWVDDHTEGWRAYAAAISGKVSPSAILGGAQRWVREINDPQFLPALPKWIKDEGWRKSPPKYYRQGEKTGRAQPDLLRESLLAGGYSEFADGSLVYEGGL